MKVGIYDPYLDTMGGGEKYMFSIASILSEEHNVSLFWNNNEVLVQGSNRFQLNLSKVKITPNIFSEKTSLLSRFKQTSSYDVLIYMSDGSIPFLFGKKNFLLFQFPTPWVNGSSFINRLKLRNIEGIICYSNFVRDFLKKTFKKKIIVLAPSIDIPKEIALKKENIILTVGRFTKGMNAKKQAEMIEAFKKLCNEGLKNWTFILAGGVLSRDYDFIEDLKKSAKGYPIEIHENISYEKLHSFYMKAKIYWHAAGFGENLLRYPERAEHFGITTVEAMSYGAVPVVFNGGGQTEIINPGTGYTWDTMNELLEKTKKLIKEKNMWEKVSQKAIERAKVFSSDVFSQNVKQLFV